MRQTQLIKTRQSRALLERISNATKKKTLFAWDYEIIFHLFLYYYGCVYNSSIYIIFIKKITWNTNIAEISLIVGRVEIVVMGHHFLCFGLSLTSEGGWETIFFILKEIMLEGSLPFPGRVQELSLKSSWCYDFDSYSLHTSWI